MGLIIEYLSWHESLLVIDGGIVLTHVLEDAGLWGHLAFYCAALCQEGLDLGAVLLNVIVVYVTLTVHVEDWGLMEV